MFDHEIFGERLAALELGGGAAGAEDGEPSLPELVGQAQHEGKLGAHDGQADGKFLREIGELDDVRRVDIHAIGEGGDSWVAGCAVNLGKERALLELPDEGVLPAAVADDEYSHFKTFFLRELGPILGVDYPTVVVGVSRHTTSGWSHQRPQSTYK